jgi:hypothetical protein
MALFAPKVEGNPHKRFPDAYYDQIYFTKQASDGIEQIANLTRKSKKETANELMERGSGVTWAIRSKNTT